jgi:putative membrane protein
MTVDPRSWLVVYAKGFCMGAADAVPGVSGGTIALITGIYERLIDAITAVGPENARRLLAGLRSDRGEALAALREMDVLFLAVLGTGLLTAVVVIASTIEHAVEAVPVPTFGFFFGLIAASAAVLVGEVSLDTTRRKLAAVAGFLLAFVVSGAAEQLIPEGSVVVVFFAGMVAISAMILPGISGSLLLLILGQYTFLTGALSTFKDSLLGVLLGTNGFETTFDSGAVVVSFLCGAVIGLFTISRIVDWALTRYREATFTFLIFLIVGALRAPVVQTSARLAETGRSWTPELVGVFAAAAVVGAAAIVLVDRYAADIDLGENESDPDLDPEEMTTGDD